MGQEIERKFLVISDRWKPPAQGVLYRQGYIPTTDNRTVRVRIAGDQGYLTLKGPVVNLVRLEFEYPIPLADAEVLLAQLCNPPLVEKRRYRISIEPLVWEVDQFLGANQGLVLAEVELTHPDQPVSLPDWIGKEVTEDRRYFNSYLAQHPFQTWPEVS